MAFLLRGAPLLVGLSLLSVAAGCRSLSSAVRHNDLNAVKQHLADGQKPDDGELNVAVQEGADVRIISALIEAGADVNAKAMDRQWELTPLQSAARHGRAEAVELLLQSGADPFARIETGALGPLVDGETLSSPLLVWLAFWHITHELDLRHESGDLEGVTRIILNHIERVHGPERMREFAHARDKQGWTALHAAAFSGDVYMIHQLLSKGVDPNVLAPAKPYRYALKGSFPDDEEFTPLQITVHRNTHAAGTELVNGGADVNARSKHGYTAAEIIAQRQREDEENRAFWQNVGQSFGAVLQGMNTVLEAEQQRRATSGASSKGNAFDRGVEALDEGVQNMGSSAGKGANGGGSIQLESAESVPEESREERSESKTQEGTQPLKIQMKPPRKPNCRPGELKRGSVSGLPGTDLQKAESHARYMASLDCIKVGLGSVSVDCTAAQESFAEMVDGKPKKSYRTVHSCTAHYVCAKPGEICDYGEQESGVIKQ